MVARTSPGPALVQRWRLTFARGAGAADLPQRDYLAEWESALLRAGLRSDEGIAQTKFVLALPPIVGLVADRDLADLLLSSRRTAHDVRERLMPNMPSGHVLVDLYDVWIGEPALPGLVAAADYVAAVTGEDSTTVAAALPDAVARLMATADIPRSKARGERVVGGNLRALIDDVRCVGPTELRMRLRIDPTAGSGRPEEVVDALGAIAGRRFTTGRLQRLRIWLKGDVGPD